SGTSSHIAGKLFKTMAGIDVLHIPYKAVMQGVLDLVAGRMTLMINVLPEMIPFLSSGKLRGIAVTGLKRSHVMPQLPTMDESGLPGYTITSWQGVLAPARTPEEIIARLNGEIAKLLRVPEMRNRMDELGFDIIGSTPEEFAQHLRTETEKWAKVVKASGSRVD
ncbi:MAG: tripartite tricarboxylate transporter substrate binding protein, partial [Betaproteobacteria bacterium]|nr:tripartite tricarboxylate transporter substrate binding protein [Betaproteobacteria bacterium]